jgi:hypothetical protein
MKIVLDTIAIAASRHRFASLDRNYLPVTKCWTIITVAAVWVVLLAAFSSAAQSNLRFAKRFQIPGASAVVVVAEGEFEARSVGSYALRVYGGAAKKFPTDDFIVGVVRPRNGTIEVVRFESVDGDDSPEIVVIMRAVGSGGYVSADAFRYREGLLEWVASVSGLIKTADPINALRDKLIGDSGGKAASK